MMLNNILVMTTKKTKNLIDKPPVVVVLGHVDHGKSSLLEAIKDFKITQKEAGGITQHIGAYQVEYKGKKITFIDTPGHFAFGAMRSRGAKIADIAILVVAAEEGVKPQTIEAMNSIKEAGIQTIVALNKIDKPEANPQKVKNELSKAEFIVEDLGGDIPCVETSATQKKGINELLELILLMREIQAVTTDLDQPAEGVVIETYLDEKRGSVATLLVQQGVLCLQDIIATESIFGKVKKMEDFQGLPLEQATPSQPVAILGFDKLPRVGEVFKVFSNVEKAQLYVIKEEEKRPLKKLEQASKDKSLNIILKADTLGSLEAVEQMINSLPQEDIRIYIVWAGVGKVNEKDIQTAIASKAKIFALETLPIPQALKLAEQKDIPIRTFKVIYELIDSLKKLMKSQIESEVVRRDLGKINILKIFRTEKGKQIIGGEVIEGEVLGNSQLEIYRDEEMIGQGRIKELQKERKVIKKGVLGDEVGMLYEGKIKVQPGDILYFYVKEKKVADF